MTQQTSSSRKQVVREQAAESGGQVSGTAADQARNIASEAQQQARNLKDQGVDQLREQARTGQQKAAGNLHSIADQLDRMTERAEESGIAQDVIREAAQRAKKVASWLDSREPGDLVGELRQFARRKPGLFLAGAAAAGLLAGRLTRGVAAAASDQGGGAPQPRTSTETTYPAGTPTESAAHPPTTGTPYPTETAYPASAPMPETQGGYRGQHRVEPT